LVNDWIGTIILLVYYLVTCFILPVLLKSWLRIPREWARKFQHVAYSLSVFILLKLFSVWYIAIAAAFLLVLVAYPTLLLIERTNFYKKLLTDRTSSGGELRKQMIYVQITFAILIFVYWGLLGTNWQYVVAVSIMAWGFGDAAAALIGKAFGQRRIIHSLIEGAKTCEGTTAMVLAATLASFLTLLLYGGLSWYASLVIAVIVGPVCGIVELFSKRGTDTFTVPLSAAALIMPLAYLFSITGW
jgi:phytol kinase